MRALWRLEIVMKLAGTNYRRKWFPYSTHESPAFQVVFLVSQERNGECQSYSARYCRCSCSYSTFYWRARVLLWGFCPQDLFGGNLEWKGQYNVVVSKLRTAGFRFSILLTVSLDEKWNGSVHVFFLQLSSWRPITVTIVRPRGRAKFAVTTVSEL